MKLKGIAVIGLILCVTVGWNPPAQAQFAVIDIGAVTQLLIEVRQLEQAEQLAQSTLGQSQQAYAAITGGRGMQSLLSGTNRNYLPGNWTQLVEAQNGAGGTYGVLGNDVTATPPPNAPPFQPPPLPATSPPPKMRSSPHAAARSHSRKRSHDKNWRM